MILGIVGAEAAKFTPENEEKARELIRTYLRTGKYAGTTSGACHLGGVDIWCKEESDKLQIPCKEYPPAILAWEGGYKERNIRIAQLADHVICITVKFAELPAAAQKTAFPFCYHCRSNNHTKSGGCWTVKYALKLGKTGEVLTV